MKKHEKLAVFASVAAVSTGAGYLALKPKQEKTENTRTDHELSDLRKADHVLNELGKQAIVKLKQNKNEGSCQGDPLKPILEDEDVYSFNFASGSKRSEVKYAVWVDIEKKNGQFDPRSTSRISVSLKDSMNDVDTEFGIANSRDTPLSSNSMLTERNGSRFTSVHLYSHDVQVVPHQEHKAATKILNGIASLAAEALEAPTLPDALCDNDRPLTDEEQQMFLGALDNLPSLAP